MSNDYYTGCTHIIQCTHAKQVDCGRTSVIPLAADISIISLLVVEVLGSIMTSHRVNVTK